MPTIKEKIYFNYDGIWSSDFDLLHVTTDNGLFEETLTASRNIIETKVKGRDKPHFAGFEDSPLEFDLMLAFENGFDRTSLDNVLSWLYQDYYKPLYFEDMEDRIYYCTPVGDSTIVHTGFGEGYIKISMRCNSPFVYSPVIVSQFYNFENSVNGTVSIFNDGVGKLYPEISIQKVGAGSILIHNINNGGEEFAIANLTDGEDIYINTEKEIIETDLSSLGVYRYNDQTGKFTVLSEGQNILEIVGRCRIQFRYQFKYRK